MTGTPSSAATPGPTEPPPYLGQLLIVDTSAWAVLRKALQEVPAPPLVGVFFRALGSYQLLGHTAVRVELLHNARNQAEFVATEAQLDMVETMPITERASGLALGALRRLSAESPAGDASHRVGHGDVLVAATAAERGVGVLHYDDHFERLADVLGIPHVWIAERGDY